MTNPEVKVQVTHLRPKINGIVCKQTITKTTVIRRLKRGEVRDVYIEYGKIIPKEVV